VPSNTPDTIPVPEPIVAIDGEPLLHDPNAVGSTKDAVAPWQTSGVPVIGLGIGLTVTDAVEDEALVQPAPVYVTVKLYIPLAAVVVGANDGAMLVEL